MIEKSRKTRIWLVVLMFIISTFGYGMAVRAEQKTLRWMDYTLGEEPVGSVLRAQAEKFMEQHPDIQLKLDPVRYDAVLTKFTTQTAAGVAPDIVLLTSENIAPSSAGLVNLEPWIDKEGGDKFAEMYWEKGLQDLSYDGTRYAIPEHFVIHLLFYNTTMFKDAALEPGKPPKTWQEFLTYTKKLTVDVDKDGLTDQWGYGLIGKGVGGLQRFLPWLHSNRASLLSEDKTRAVFNEPNGLEAFKFHVELFTKHHVTPPGTPTADYPTVLAQFCQERVSMFIGGSYVSDIILEQNPELEGRYGICEIPVKEQKAAMGRAVGYAISSQSDYPEEAWEFVKYLTNTENQEEYFKRTHFIPAQKAAFDTPELQPGGTFYAFQEVIPYLVKFPVIEEWGEVAKTLCDAYEAALMESKTPRKALDDAAHVVNRILSR